MAKQAKTATLYVKIDGKLQLVTGYVDLQLHARITKMHAQALGKAREGHEVYTAHMTELRELQRQAQQYIVAHPVEQEGK